jgi:hypothetical protein
MHAPEHRYHSSHGTHGTLASHPVQVDLLDLTGLSRNHFVSGHAPIVRRCAPDFQESAISEVR